MPYALIEAIGAITALSLIGTFALVGMKMRMTHKENLAKGGGEDMDRLVEAVDVLSEQVEQLTAENAEIQERLDFTERLLANPRQEVESPTPT